jgi:5-methyltetrahydrofolate--homocysteine methyltransferase
MNTYILSELNIKMSPKSVLKRLDGGVNRKKWAQVVDRIVKNYASRIRPKGVYHKISCRPNGTMVDIGRGFFLRSEFLRKRLGKNHEAAIFLVTIGPEIEDIIKNESLEGKNITAYILDCLGSSAAESSAAAIQSVVQAEFGMKMCRYSPGYNDWHIEQQKILFEFLGPDVTRKLGVNLTPDYMMSPRKSVSGIVIPKDGT